MSADQWTPGERLAAIVAQEINDAPAEELIKAATDDVLRSWAVKIRETGTAKGWSVWAAAFLDPDVSFVETGMPSTETIVAELRRLDRVAVLRVAADRIDGFCYPPSRMDTFQHGVRWVLHCLRRLANEAEREKGTSDGELERLQGQPPAPEGTKR